MYIIYEQWKFKFGLLIPIWLFAFLLFTMTTLSQLGVCTQFKTRWLYSQRYSVTRDSDGYILFLNDNDVSLYAQDSARQFNTRKPVLVRQNFRIYKVK